MADRKAPRTHEPTQPILRGRNRKTIPSSDVGVTLTISDHARDQLDRIQEETVKAAQQGQKFSWR